MTTAAPILSDLRAWYQKHRKELLQDYFTFLRFQSVSSEPVYKPQVLACADWLCLTLKNIGFDVQQWETSGHPTLFATHLKAGPDKPTLLLYNHYDVQPVDPLDQWLSSPFEPTIRNGEVYARGAQDNKGQCFYTLLALKALLQPGKELPINIKWCIEGEEECGSAGLAGILSQRQEELRADYLAIVDVGIPSPTTPAVTLGVRGLVSLDVEVQGSLTDLHSGSNGGLAYNPIHALVAILAAARDPNGKITIPGFYDDIVPLEPSARAQLYLDFDAAQYEKTVGAKATGGEKELAPLERVWTRPTLEINGITGGYSGTGFKTVIPAKASAKVSCRLVANQDPEKIGQLVARFLEAHAPAGVTVSAKVHRGHGRAVRADANSPVAQAFAKAYSEIFNTPCRFIFEGASIPIVTALTAISQSEVVLVGLGLADDQIHAPNEHFGLDRLEKGMLIMARAIQLLEH